MAESSATCLQLLNEHFKTASSSWCRIADELQIALNHPVDQLLRECPASKFILTWMREAKSFHKSFSSLFGRGKQPPLADDFTAAVAFCLEQFLAAKGHSDRVRSEEKIHLKQGAIRPDVSVQTAAKSIVVTVECKTNLGWIRDKWKEQYEERNADLLESWPDALSYLCVLSRKNISREKFLEEFLESEYYRKQWFCLSEVSVRNITDPGNDILDPIELMFIDILDRLKAKEGVGLVV